MGITYSFPKDICDKLLQYVRRKAKLSKLRFNILFEVNEAMELVANGKLCERASMRALSPSVLNTNTCFRSLFNPMSELAK